jgi:hypothetical protein
MRVYLNEPADIKYICFQWLEVKVHKVRIIAQQILNVWFSETYPSDMQTILMEMHTVSFVTVVSSY